ncbi:MAG: hypothetical protein A2287_08205 [Candidatus Melainabacteria bacterium RIFOXYA12_FULL_32_12]|nr:MAG: hypothetical protein A2255_01995 [Candidatus Melainabacteria bacterium RIFOXYA2_FULL_32_9]OGI31771.1 MAG: hypothetical protein A2287_08205 [Candidatus Melainabacteria bacterium RIFOXYA12_FULL_32_12]
MADIYDFIKELAKIDIEIEDKEHNFYSLKSYVKRVEEDRILIDTPSNNGVTYNIPVGQTISLGIHADGGIYLGESKVIDKELSTISGLWICHPYFTQHIQRREYLRVPASLEAELTVFIDRQKTEKKVYNIKTKDISGSGFSYTSNEPLDQYYDIECTIYINDSDNEPVISRCEHVYSKKITYNGEIRYINAFTFVDIKQKDVGRLVKASFKYQVELRKKGFIIIEE